MMQDLQATRLERGVFTISLDFELIWGTLDLFGPGRFRAACEVERQAVGRLLDLFAEYDIPATWCTLGHLFLDCCEAEGGRKHPEIVRPTHSWCRHDWFEHDPCGDEGSAPTFFARSLIDQIRACPVTQEIGCHGFSHVIFGDPGCSRLTAESEVAECVRLASAMGIRMSSFAFPRNRVGHLDVLLENGFVCYRGAEPNWYEHARWPGAVRRLAHLWEVFTAATPPLVLPERTPSGLWNIPGSMIYFPMHGLRRFIPLSVRVKRAVKGLDAAAREKKVFHLWFHPTNMADRMDAMFAGLRSILDHARTLHRRGVIDFLPMKGIVPVGDLPGNSLVPAAEAEMGPRRL